MRDRRLLLAELAALLTLTPVDPRDEFDEERGIVAERSEERPRFPMVIEKGEERPLVANDARAIELGFEVIEELPDFVRDRLRGCLHWVGPERLVEHLLHQRGSDCG